MYELNKIYNEDSINALKKMPAKSIQLIHTDPPYNIGIDKWDKWETQEAYVEWCGTWIKECERVLKDNGSFYFWHNDIWQSMKLLNWIDKNTSFIFNSFIVWDKGDFRALSWKNPRPDNNLRSWFNTTEFCFFFTFADGTGLEKITEEHIKPKNPFSKYLRQEFKKAKVSNKEISKLFPSKTGGLTGCVSNWLNGDNIITKEQYLIIRKFLNFKYLRKEYEDLRKEYEDLRKEYEYLRYPFNLAPNHNNVWRSKIKNTGKHHICEKPLDLIDRIIKCSSNKGDTVLDLFAGSGSTCISAHRLNRNFLAFELDKKNFDIAEKRLNKIQNQSNFFDLFD